MSTESLTAAFSAAARPEITTDPGRSVGVLLCHGFTGSPASMRPWAEALAERGYGVEVPLLPGHGTTWQEMNATGWADWHAAVEQAFARVRAAHDVVVVAGLSMGGALALRMTIDHPDDVAGVVLVNPGINSTNKQLLALPVLKWLLPSMPAIGNDIKKAGADEHGYDRTPLKALSSMLDGWKQLRADLARVRVPVQVFKSVDDHVLDPSSVQLITQHIPTAEVTLLHDSFHVATIDNDAQQIFDDSAAFIRSVTGV
ncbi:alpha/beta fold hydrolase [Nocardioides dubius]|uniref:Alpha/beta fold hydrolase n=1 Tax=Nocardioides dubius TaxID=317019 RepID=A0ABN1TQ07_9ACTN